MQAVTIIMLLLFLFVGIYLTLFSHQFAYWLEKVRLKWKRQLTKYWGFELEEVSFFPAWLRLWGRVLWRIVGLLLIVASTYILYKLLF